jgi:divalent metal cation (Fe/Co/Zn/Cd) transporter
VLKLAYEIGKDSVDILMERNVSAEKLAHYENLLRTEDRVKRIDRVRAREHGHYIIVDIRVGVPHDYTIQQGHDLSKQLKKLIMDFDPDVVEVMIHLNPWEERKLITSE